MNSNRFNSSKFVVWSLKSVQTETNPRVQHACLQTHVRQMVCSRLWRCEGFFLFSSIFIFFTQSYVLCLKTLTKHWTNQWVDCGSATPWTEFFFTDQVIRQPVKLQFTPMSVQTHMKTNMWIKDPINRLSNQPNVKYCHILLFCLHHGELDLWPFLFVWNLILSFYQVNNNFFRLIQK